MEEEKENDYFEEDEINFFDRMIGWTCPVCWKTNSPFVKDCDCHKQPDIEMPIEEPFIWYVTFT